VGAHAPGRSDLHRVRAWWCRAVRAGVHSPTRTLAAIHRPVRRDRHSFTVIDVEVNRLLLRQLSNRGVELDRIVVTKQAGQ
jgi:hypothetical protein